MIKIVLRKVLPKDVYQYLRKLRLSAQFRYLDLRYRGKKSTYNYRGYKFIVRNGTDDDAIVREVMGGDYNIDSENYDVVVDIGAHIGAYSILMANRANKVYSFEPNPESFELLKRNVKKINKNNILIYPVGLANSKRIDRLFVSPYSTGACGMYGGEPTKSIEIKCITLKEFMQKNDIKKIDLLKIDCEGVEYEIIKSLNTKDLSKIKRIVMETHQLENDPLKNHIWMKDYLKKKGYGVSEKINKINGNYYLFAKKEN